MNNRSTTYACSFGLGLVFATLLGCSDSAAGGGVAAVDQRDGVVPRVPAAVEEAVGDSAETAIDTSTSGDEDAGQPDGIDDKTEEAQLAYRWPNPDRSEIFLPPAGKAASVTIDSRNDNGVTLVGFVNVDRQQVLLEIDGTIVPLTAGDSRGELQVLAIDPPKVTLKQGDREWTIKLFDLHD